MKVLFASSEAKPFAASGGLADVAGSLPKALKNRMVGCRVIMPLYKGIGPDLRKDIQYLCSFNVDLGWRRQYCGLFESVVDGVHYYFLDNEYYFYRDNLYGYFDDAERFAFFSKAILEAVLYMDFEPDIIHCNDWQTALVPVYLDAFYRGGEKYKRLKTVFTIHNIQFQGKYGLELAGDVLGIPDNMAKVLEYDGCVNFMKGAIELSDKVTTVSPTYADEILDPWYSFGLDRFLREKQWKLAGILNGIDTVANDPAKEKSIYANYSKSEPANKRVNKRGLIEEFHLSPDGDKPLVGIVARLTAQKGMDLIEYVFDEIIRAGMQVIVLGSGDKEYEQFLRNKRAQYPDDVAFIAGFRPDVAKKIYAGCDIFLMPSKTEPCGLAQMLALRYGTIPVVRKTGGLRDSIADYGEGEGNGFTFETYNAHDMLGALLRAGGLYSGDKKRWGALVAHALAEDFSWGVSAAKYKTMYQSVLK